jgi:hypothetical protein
LGIGPQSPIPNPQSPSIYKIFYRIKISDLISLLSDIIYSVD